MKVKIIILVLIAAGCVLSLINLVILGYSDIYTHEFNNIGGMLICVIIFWVTFYLGTTIQKSIKNDKSLPIPEEDRLIRITWLKHCRNVSSNIPNPYIGMIGYVRNLKPDGSFDLKCESCWLIVITEYKFEYLD
jgi:hypothetical protein